VRGRVFSDPDLISATVPERAATAGLEGTRRSAPNSNKLKAKGIIERLLRLLEPAND
jgi:hypothetical protein